MTVTKKRQKLTPAKTVKVTEARRCDEVAKAAGGPCDNATYRCDCGNEFSAAVSTSVACPRCGADQAW